MANTRLERIGTIFSRVASLIQGKARHPDDVPIWYPIYQTFPPKLEPRYDRAAPNIEIRDIFYKEDVIRARFQKEHAKILRNYNLLNNDTQTHTQRFMAIYDELEKSGTVEGLYDKALETFKAQNLSFRESRHRGVRENSEETIREIDKQEQTFNATKKLDLKTIDLFNEEKS